MSVSLTPRSLPSLYLCTLRVSLSLSLCTRWQPGERAITPRKVRLLNHDGDPARDTLCIEGAVHSTYLQICMSHIWLRAQSSVSKGLPDRLEEDGGLLDDGGLKSGKCVSK